MWFKKKSELEKMILEYGKDTDELLQFARTCGKQRIEECSEYDLIRFYKEYVEPQASRYFRQESIRKLNKFLKAYEVPYKLLEFGQVESLTKYDKIEPMKIERKTGGRGKAETIRNKAIVELRKADDKTFSFYALGKLFGISTIRAIQINKEYGSNVG